MIRPRVVSGLLLLLISGCEGCTLEDVQEYVGAQFPTTGRIAAVGAVHETPFQVTAEAFDPEDPESDIGIYEVRATLTSLSEATFTAATVLDATEPIPNGTRYTGDVDPLPLGRYEMRVEYVLQYADSVPAEDGLVLEETTTVTVGESDACFTFGEADNAEGWTPDGLWDIVSSASEPNGDLTSIALRSGCSIATFNSAARVSLPSCFPQGLEPQSGSVAFDFVSPDLSDDPAWQSAIGVAFATSADMVSVADTGDVQAIVTRADGQGGTTSYAPGAEGDREFFDFGDGVFQWLWGDDGLPGSMVSGRVRIFLIPMALTGESGVLIMGSYCPITSS